MTHNRPVFVFILTLLLAIGGLSANAQSAEGLYGHRQSVQLIAHSKPSLLYPNDNMRYFGWGEGRSLLAWTCSYELLLALTLDEYTEIGISALLNLNYQLTDSTEGTHSAFGVQYRRYIAQVGSLAPLGIYAVAHSRYLHAAAHLEGDASIQLPYLQLGIGLGFNKAIPLNDNLLLGAQLNALTHTPLYFAPDTLKSDLLRQQVNKRLHQAYAFDLALTAAYYF